MFILHYAAKMAATEKEAFAVYQSVLKFDLRGTEMHNYIVITNYEGHS